MSSVNGFVQAVHQVLSDTVLQFFVSTVLSVTITRNAVASCLVRVTRKKRSLRSARAFAYRRDSAR
jgi:hypothetical protein